MISFHIQPLLASSAKEKRCKSTLQVELGAGNLGVGERRCTFHLESRKALGPYASKLVLDRYKETDSLSLLSSLPQTILFRPSSLIVVEPYTTPHTRLQTKQCPALPLPTQTLGHRRESMPSANMNFSPLHRLKISKIVMRHLQCIS
jgi:hypothetical protein